MSFPAPHTLIYRRAAFVLKIAPEQRRKKCCCRKEGGARRRGTCHACKRRVHGGREGWGQAVCCASRQIFSHRQPLFLVIDETLSAVITSGRGKAGDDGDAPLRFTVTSLDIDGGHAHITHKLGKWSE